MALRFSRIFEGDGTYDNLPEGRGVDLGGNQDVGAGNDPAPAPTAPSAPSEPPPQTGGSEPGPATPPSPPRGNPIPPAPPVPPAVPSAVQGVQQSEATGGVRGTFAQAGSSGLTKRFGSPAAWFRGAQSNPAGAQALMAEVANRGRGVLGRQSSGSNTGGSVVPVSSGPSLDPMANDKQNIDWQRLLAEVMKQRFGG